MVSALSVLAVLVLVFISLALGSTLTKNEFIVAVKKKPKSLILAIFTQYAIMPLYLYGLYHASDLSREDGLGYLLIGVSPGGASANLLVYLTKADVALTIVATSTATITALGMMPLLLYLYVDLGGISGSSLTLDYTTIVVTGVVLVLPAFVGIYIRKKSAIWAKRVEKAGSGIGLVFLIAAVIVGVTGETHIFQASGKVWAAAWSLQLFGTAFGYFTGWVFGCSRKDCRVIAWTTGIQNSTIAISVATLSFENNPEVRDKVLVYPLLETFCYLINCIFLVIFFRFFVARYDQKEDNDELVVPADETDKQAADQPIDAMELPTTDSQAHLVSGSSLNSNSSPSSPSSAV